MYCLLLFLDGIGLGTADPQTNPFARQPMPTLTSLLGGERLYLSTFDSQARHSEKASWLALDACLGVPGLPQSATGQATLLTGHNIPLLVGEHDGPKPGQAISAHLNNGNLFNRLRGAGHTTALVNAYPPRYFAAIKSGLRLPGVIAMAALHSGTTLKTARDLQSGQAISADITGQGWYDHLQIQGIPCLAPAQAGVNLARLSTSYSFSIFEYWLSDVVGHRQDMQQAGHLLETLDKFIEGLSRAWAFTDGLIIITSDHGNLEDLGTRRHTTNPVPLILIGSPDLRERFLAGMRIENPGWVTPDLTRVAPAIEYFLG